MLLLWGLAGPASAGLALEGRAVDVNCSPGPCIQTYALDDPLLTAFAVSISAGQSVAGSRGHLATGELAALAQAAPVGPPSGIDPFGNLAIAQVTMAQTVQVQGAVLSPVTATW